MIDHQTAAYSSNHQTGFRMSAQGQLNTLQKQKSITPIAKIQFLDGRDITIRSLPFNLYFSDEKRLVSTSFSPESGPVIQIQEKEGQFTLTTELKCWVNKEENIITSNLGHKSLVYFEDEEYDMKPNIFHYIYSQPTMLRKGIFDSSNNSIFMPIRASIFVKPAPIQGRLVTNKWYFEEREHLKKFLLVYGYGRWDKIREAAKDSILQYNQKLDIGFDNKPKEHLKAYANSFIRSVSENLSFDMMRLQPFLLNLIEESHTDPILAVKSKDWDLNLIRQRSNLWAKRLRFLHRVKIFKQVYERYYEKKFKRAPRTGIEYHNMLNMIDTSMLLGQRPSVWWTRYHDIDLIVGTFIYGYANYSKMKEDLQFGFSTLEKCCLYSDFPNADTLTRRLKKLVALIVRHEATYKSFDFDSTESIDSALREFQEEEVRHFFNFVKSFGVPLGSDKKSNWNDLRDRFFTEYPNYEQKVVSSVEKLVQYFRMASQRAIYGSMMTEEQKLLMTEIKLTQTSSGAKQFEIGIKEAQEFFKNCIQLRFLRKWVVPNKASMFNLHRAKWVIVSKEIQKEHPAWFGWVPGYQADVHDLKLLNYVVKNGYDKLREIFFEAGSCFENLEIPLPKLRARIDILCEFFKKQKDYSNLKKRKTEKRSSSKTSKKRLKKKILRDENGNIIFPVQVSSSLRLLAHGTIRPGPHYHSTHNLFPIGYKSERLYASMIYKNQKARYTCEIMDGGLKPIYKVTCSDVPDSPIIKDSSTGCWVYICKKVNDMAEHKKQKVTISGTERFGLLEDTVRKILENLPNSEKCSNYAFKTRVPPQTA